MCHLPRRKHTALASGAVNSEPALGYGYRFKQRYHSTTYQNSSLSTPSWKKSSFLPHLSECKSLRQVKESQLLTQSRYYLLIEPNGIIVGVLPIYFLMVNPNVHPSFPITVIILSPSCFVLICSLTSNPGIVEHNMVLMLRR